MRPTKVLCCLDKSFSLVWPRAAAAKSPCCWVEINHIRDSRTTCHCNKQQSEIFLKKHMKKKMNKYSSVLLMLFSTWWQGFLGGFLVLVVFLKTEANSAGYVAFLFVHSIIARLYYVEGWRPCCFNRTMDDPGKRVFITAGSKAQASFYPLPLSCSDTSFKFRFALCHLSLSVSYLLSFLHFHAFIELGLTVSSSLRLPPLLSPPEPFRFSFTHLDLIMIVIKQTFLNNEVGWHLYLFVQPTFSF